MKFIGTYTQDLKNLLTASAVSGQNVMTISAPGWGKTEMALETARSIYGDQHTVFVEITPSTGPEVITGAYDPAAMLNGQLKRVISGTPYDPNAQVVILDELWRGNDPLFDTLVHATSMKQRAPKDRPVFWATSNFIGKAERVEALRDRFSLWFWMDGQLDVRGMTLAHLQNGTGRDLTWGQTLPDLQTVSTIRSATPGTKAQNAVCDLIEALAGEAVKAGMTVNPRRIEQWSALLFSYSMYKTGSDDFNAIPSDVSQMLRYCYPNSTREAAAKWTEVALSIVDQVGAAIEAFKAAAYGQFQTVAQMKNPAERAAAAAQLGGIIAEAQIKLAQWGNDPRAKEAVDELTVWLRKAVLGEAL